MIKAGIYIHIPFCTSKCNYCDFYSLEEREEDMQLFVNMLIREIELTAHNYKEDWMFDTIFFGGGTPSIMEPQWLKNVLHTLYGPQYGPIWPQLGWVWEVGKS